MFIGFFGTPKRIRTIDWPLGGARYIQLNYGGLTLKVYYNGVVLVNETRIAR